MGDLYIPSSVAAIGAQAFAAINGVYGTVQFGTATRGSRLCRLAELNPTSQEVTVAIFTATGSVGAFTFYASSTAQKNAIMKLVDGTDDNNKPYQTLAMFSTASTKSYTDAGDLSS